MELTKEQQEEIREILSELLAYEPINDQTRKIARLCTRTYLIGKDIDYKLVKCDEENNSPDIVDQNNLIVDIYTKDYKYYTIII
jgi:hypothetical protein